MCGLTDPQTSRLTLCDAQIVPFQMDRLSRPSSTTHSGVCGGVYVGVCVGVCALFFVMAFPTCPLLHDLGLALALALALV